MTHARLAEMAEPLRLQAFRRLWAAQLSSEVGDQVARVALAMLVFERTGSPMWAAVVFVFGLLPWLGPGQLLATLPDRVGRRAVMVAADLTPAAVFLAWCLPMPLAVLLGLTFVAGLAAPPFEAARAAALSEVVPARQLPGALRLSGGTQDQAMVAGNLLGGLVLARRGAQRGHEPAAGRGSRAVVGPAGTRGCRVGDTRAVRVQWFKRIWRCREPAPIGNARPDRSRRPSGSQFCDIRSSAKSYVRHTQKQGILRELPASPSDLSSRVPGPSSQILG